MFEKLMSLFFKYDEQLIGLLLNLVVVGIIFVIGSNLSKACARLLERVLKERAVDSTLIGFSVSLLKNTIFILTLIIILGRLGFETASFVAIIGAAGLAIGLALQGSLANFAAGVLLIIFKPFRAGDLVDVSVLGVVESVQIFSTVLTLNDGRIAVIPNSKILAENIINYTRDPNRRIDLFTYVSYDSDLDQVKKVLVKSVRQTEKILLNQPTIVRVEELTRFGVKFFISAWTTNRDYAICRSTLLENIKKELDNNNITIARPHYDHNLKKTEMDGVEKG